MQRSLRSNTQINLIGFEQFQILGTKLPTSKDVLQVFFYNSRTLKMKLHESATLGRHSDKTRTSLYRKT